MGKFGHNYRGTLATTVSGKTCQKWTSISPHHHGYLNPDWFPDDTIEDAVNYCRNPDALWEEGLWCYTTDPTVRWEACHVPMCGIYCQILSKCVGYCTLGN